MLALRIGMGLKAIDALFEMIVGAFLFTPMKLGDIVDRFCRAEMFDHFRAEKAANALQHHAANAIHHSSPGVATYLLIHGAVKLVFIAGAAWQKSWGYIGLVSMLSLFVVFEVFHAVAKSSGFMVFLAVFDALLAFLAWREYRKHDKPVKEPVALKTPQTEKI